MKLVIQRVKNAGVSVDGETVGKIGRGYMVLLGVGKEDTEETARAYAEKMIKLRINADENGKTNLSLADVGGELLIVSQFTLYADTSHGNRPNFLLGADPEKANSLYEYFVKYCRDRGIHTETGIFAAHMEVSLVNDGPFTITL